MGLLLGHWELVVSRMRLGSCVLVSWLAVLCVIVDAGIVEKFKEFKDLGEKHLGKLTSKLKGGGGEECKVIWEEHQQPHCSTEYVQVCDDTCDEQCTTEYVRQCTTEYNNQWKIQTHQKKPSIVISLTIVCSSMPWLMNSPISKILCQKVPFQMWISVKCKMLSNSSGTQLLMG